MVDELGIEPSDTLQELEHSILISDPSIKPPARPIGISQVRSQVLNLLPTDIADFTGRVKQLTQIQKRLLDTAARTVQSPVPVVVIGGKAE